LLGGAGSDTLDGGKGIDTLKGGKDYDTYVLRAETSDVTDTIIDSDGLGCIKVYGLDGSETVLTMSGGKKLADGSNIWQSQDQRFTFTLIAESGASNTLRIDGAGVKALVKSFTSGNLGIDLPGAAEIPANPTTNLTILGDLAPANDPLQQDELGNVITTDVAAPGRNDTLFDSTGDDKIDAGGGADLVTGSRGGNDWIRSADGDDVVFEYGGDDLIELGAGRDIGYGGSGKDRMFGHTVMGLDVVLGQTVAAPASERDIVDGGAGDDTVVADGGGKDLLVGRAGVSTFAASCTANDAVWRAAA
jgi:Ca2+-binding RTX toxin-like protein